MGGFENNEHNRFIGSNKFDELLKNSFKRESYNIPDKIMQNLAV